MTDHRKPPAHYEDLAESAENEGRWLEAAEHWRNAAGASIGHARGERYERAASAADAKARESAPVQS